MSDRDAPVVAATFTDRYEAELMQRLLESEGIPSWVRADDAGGQHPQLSLARGVRLLVRTRDLEEAKLILEPPGDPEEGLT